MSAPRVYVIPPLCAYCNAPCFQLPHPPLVAMDSPCGLGGEPLCESCAYYCDGNLDQTDPLDDDRDDGPEEFTESSAGRDALDRWARSNYENDRD